MTRAPPLRADGVLFAAAALTAGGVVAVAPLEVSSVACLTLFVAHRAARVTTLVAIATLVALAAGAARANGALARQAALEAAADAALPRPVRCSAVACVASSPVRVRGAIRWDASLTQLACDGEPVDWAGRATLYGGPEDLARGDVVEVIAALARQERFWNAATGDPRPAQAHRGVLRSGSAVDVRRKRRGAGVLATVDRVRARIRGRIDATFEPELGAMARALVLGESDLATSDDQTFRASGLSHLLAVSGMHLVLVVGSLVRACEGTLRRIERVAASRDAARWVAAPAIAVTWVYAELAGAGGSTVRAAWMATASLAARATGRRPDAPRAFALSLAAMALADPLVAFDVSFALSAAATGGLLAFAEPIGTALAARAPRRCGSIAKAIATTLAATLPCAPLLARFAPTLSLGGVVANLLAVPVGESAALPLCLVHACLGAWPAAERGCAASASGALRIVRQLARWAALPPFTPPVPLPSSWQLAVMAVWIAGWLLAVRWRRATSVASALALVALEWGARQRGAPHGLLRATFLDVGQGDAAIVDLPDGEALIVDGGGLVGSPIDVGQRVLAPELRARRRDRVRIVVLSHPHPDHFGGLVTGLEAVHVGELWDTGQGEAEQTGGGYAELLAEARRRGTRVLRPDALCGPHDLGGARVEVLAPCPTFSSDRGPNDNSLVVRIAYGRRALLFVGDAEREEEATLLAAPGSLRADVLKVGHHGSRTSSTAAMLAAVAPEVAVVSVGRRNHFGHPSPTTLDALSAIGARVFRTDRDGAVTVATDGDALDVSFLARAAARREH